MVSFLASWQTFEYATGGNNEQSKDDTKKMMKIEQGQQKR